MSTHKSNAVSWKTLIDDSEEAMRMYRHKIEELRKSIIFFKKQEEAERLSRLQTNKRKIHMLIVLDTC
jgi:hypothetical protein